MPRYYRRRYTKVVKPKKKWASNIRDILLDTGTDALGIPYLGVSTVLCANSTETNVLNAPVAPNPTILKTGNFKVQSDVHIQTSQAAFIRASLYIMYIPEGVYVESGAATYADRLQADYLTLQQLVKKHPEWILAWRHYGIDFVSGNYNVDKVTFSSRLKRNLNSGDQICAVFLAVNEVVGPQIRPISRVLMSGTCQFWTCAN